MKVTIDDVEYVPRITVSRNNNLPLRRLFANARQKLGLTLKQVSDRTGLHITTVYNAESCVGVPALPTVLQLCELYGIDFGSAAKCLIDEMRKEGKLK